MASKQDKFNSVLSDMTPVFKPQPKGGDLLTKIAGDMNQKDHVIMDIAPEKLVPWSDENGGKQPFSISEERVQTLADSMKNHKVIDPLIVRELPDGTYQIIAGHTRCEAAKRAGLATLPCIVRSYDDAEAREIIIDSNITRIKYKPSELCLLFDFALKHREDTDLTVSEIARKFGVGVKTFYRYLLMKQLIPELRTGLDEGTVDINVMDTISGLTEEEQIELYSDYFVPAGVLTKKEVTEYITVLAKRKGVEAPEPKNKPTKAEPKKSSSNFETLEGTDEDTGETEFEVGYESTYAQTDNAPESDKSVCESATDDAHSDAENDSEEDNGTGSVIALTLFAVTLVTPDGKMKVGRFESTQVHAMEDVSQAIFELYDGYTVSDIRRIGTMQVNAEYADKLFLEV